MDRNITGVSGTIAVARLWPNSADNAEPLTVVAWLLNFIESYELSSGALLCTPIDVFMQNLYPLPWFCHILFRCSYSPLSAISTTPY